jgi:hypothetical protein
MIIYILAPNRGMPRSPAAGKLARGTWRGSSTMDWISAACAPDQLFCAITGAKFS